MCIQYGCRYCGSKIGEIDFQYYHKVQTRLLHFTEVERNEMISYHNGVMDIQVICEECQDILEQNPYYYQYHTYVQ